MDLKFLHSPSKVGKVKVRATPTRSTGKDNSANSKPGFPKRNFKKAEADRDKPLNRSATQSSIATQAMMAISYFGNTQDKNIMG